MPLTLYMLNRDKSSYENSADPDQLASEKPADLIHTVFNPSYKHMLTFGILQVNLI